MWAEMTALDTRFPPKQATECSALGGIFIFGKGAQKSNEEVPSDRRKDRRRCRRGGRGRGGNPHRIHKALLQRPEDSLFVIGRVWSGSRADVRPAQRPPEESERLRLRAGCMGAEGGVRGAVGETIGPDVLHRVIAPVRLLHILEGVLAGFRSSLLRGLRRQDRGQQQGEYHAEYQQKTYQPFSNFSLPRIFRLSFSFLLSLLLTGSGAVLPPPARWNGKPQSSQQYIMDPRPHSVSSETPSKPQKDRPMVCAVSGYNGPLPGGRCSRCVPKRRLHRGHPGH